MHTRKRILKIMSSHKIALAQAEELGEISDKNMIHYFRNELVSIGKGQKATKLLTGPVIRKLVSIGILRYNKGPRIHTLTEKGINILHKSSE